MTGICQRDSCSIQGVQLSVVASLLPIWNGSLSDFPPRQGMALAMPVSAGKLERSLYDPRSRATGIRRTKSGVGFSRRSTLVDPQSAI
jgi:hypothetical protein